MGTNYYLVEDVPSKCCPMCGEPKKIAWRYHIGKSSAGWCFAVHVDQDEGILSLDDLLPKFFDDRFRIEDEYGDTYSAIEMCQIIMNRYREGGKFSAEFLDQNFAIMGPGNLLRSIHTSCKSHGAGPWDYVAGEFS